MDGIFKAYSNVAITRAAKTRQQLKFYIFISTNFSHYVGLETIEHARQNRADNRRER
jgi:hypothetical protein